MRLIFALLFSVLVVLTLGAQTTTSSINGRVMDNNGETLVGATIVAVHIPSGTQYATIANSDGYYNLQGMRTGGPYKVMISFVGYETLELTDVTLSLGEPSTFDVKLKDGMMMDEVVVVSTSDDRFKAKRTGAGANFNRAVLENTPTTDRSIADVARLTPMASSTKGAKGGISFAGANNRYNSFLIDGTVSNDVFGLTDSGTNGGQAEANPISMETIEAIQVVIAPYDVRQSGFTGGGINAVTKSGTNTYKGSAYSYFRNQDLVGKGANGQAIADQTTQTYGATLGGPIIKDKLFFFVSGEYYNSKSPETDYSQSVDGFVTAGQIKELAQIYKQHTGYTLDDTFKPRVPKLWSTNVMSRIDWNINEDHKLMLRYSFTGASKDRYTTSASDYYFYDAAFDQVNRTHSVVAELQSRFANTLWNELRVGWTSVRDWREAHAPAGAPNVSVTLTNPTCTGSNRTNTVYLGTEYCSHANRLEQDIFTLTDNLTWYKGNHTFTFGIHNEFYKMYNVYAQNATGNWSFNSLEDFRNNKANSFSYTYFNTNDLDKDGNWGGKFGAAQLGLYIQDEWRPNADFTLTYGMRIDNPVLFDKPTANDEFNNSDLAKKHNVRIGDVPSGKILYSPRVGFRWFVDKEHQVLLRGGAGLFTGRVPFVWISNNFSNNGIEQVSIKSYDQDKNPVLGQHITGEDVKNKGFKASSSTINVVDKDFKYPQVFRVNLATDVNFGAGWQATLEALYSKSLNDLYVRNIGYEPTGAHFTAVPGVPASSAPIYQKVTSYSDVIYMTNTSKGYTYSVTAQLKKTFPWGLSVDAAYTFGHSYTTFDGTSSVAYSNWKKNLARNTNDPDLAVSGFDVPHRVMASVNYNKSYGKNKRWSTHASLVYVGQSGQPYSLTYYYKKNLDAKAGGGYSMNGDGYNGNDLIYIPTQADMDKMNWKSDKDKADFEAFIRSDKRMMESRGQYSERNQFRMPFEHQFDLSLSQDFCYDVKRGGKVTLMWTVMNLANLLNKDWGKYYAHVTSYSPLTVSSVEVSDAGDVTPTFSYASTDKYLDDLYSRWRMQLGIRVTF